ncbi:HpcH/HpaI aldolase/citrate lyase family protein [Nocardia alni]|uniref:HpcH/HpaI aldolase/citrate lyase family protein n=1 Tax=Nocardia alni TaxID=2815723 RepID=UPI001C22305F|nr:aldolase/citrate lyase family protein [Nocardia alni]
MTRTSAPQTVSVPAIHARSWLLVPGSRPDRFDDAANSAADAVIFDLEDGVIPSAKGAARGHVTEFLGSTGTGWVRINNATTADWSIDLAALAGVAGLSGVMLAKTESPEQIDRTAARLPGIPVLALVESARGIEFAFEIASADAVVRLAFGTGDFRRDTNVDANALAYARSRLVVASRAADIAAPIDGPCVTGPADLPSELAVTKSMGMSGKLCMHARDAEAVNHALSPQPDEITWAADIISRLGAAGENVSDGSDLPKLARAHRINHMADVFAGF